MPIIRTPPDNSAMSSNSTSMTTSSLWTSAFSHSAHATVGLVRSSSVEVDGAFEDSNHYPQSGLGGGSETERWEMGGLVILGTLILVMITVLATAIRLIFNDVGRSSRHLHRLSSRKTTIVRQATI